MYSNIIYSMFLISTFFLLFIFFIYCYKSYFIKNFLIKKISVREKIKNMVLISLFGAIGTSFVIFLNYFGSSAIIPTARIAFQSLIIKISGFFFGPIVGVTTALMTEIGIITFVPIYFHIKITIIVVCQGIVSGFSEKIKNKKKYRLFQVLFLFLFLIFCFLITIFFSIVSSKNKEQNEKIINIFNIKNIENIFIFKKEYWFSKIFFYISISIFIFLFLSILIIIFLLLFFGKKENKITKFFYEIIPIMFLSIISEYFVSIGISTNMNQDLLGQTNKSADLLINVGLILAPIKLTLNIIIIYSIWKVLNPFLKERKINV